MVDGLERETVNPADAKEVGMIELTRRNGVDIKGS